MRTVTVVYFLYLRTCLIMWSINSTNLKILIKIMFLKWNVKFISPLCTCFSFIFWLTETDPFTLRYRMKLNKKKLNDKWTLNERWVQVQRFVNAWWAHYKCLREQSGKRKCTNGERTVSTWWTQWRIGK